MKYLRDRHDVLGGPLAGSQPIVKFFSEASALREPIMGGAEPPPPFGEVFRAPGAAQTQTNLRFPVLIRPPH